jgi:hypothetical protein
MSGNEESDQDFVLGRWNRAQDVTLLAADVRPDGDNPFTYQGNAVFIAKVADRPFDSSAYDPGDGSVPARFQPNQPVNGVVGEGWSGYEDNLNEGTGVVGIGGYQQGAGVEGFGGGLYRNGLSGSGGVGVRGRGGNDSGTFRRGEPGAGVVGYGGQLTGGRSWPGPFLNSAPGVVGVCGGANYPDATVTNHAGVVGVSDVGPGGVFQADYSAQLRLIPAKSPRRFGLDFTATPTYFKPDRLGDVSLPKIGKIGDLYCMTDPDGKVGLWFCILSSNDRGSNAAWVQILTGPPTEGSV